MKEIKAFQKHKQIINIMLPKIKLEKADRMNIDKMNSKNKCKMLCKRSSMLNSKMIK
jgi:hypothetical protein